MTETVTQADVTRWQEIARRAQIGTVIPLVILASGLTVVLLGSLWSWFVWKQSGGTPRISAYGFTLRSYGIFASGGIAGAGAMIWSMDLRARRRTGAALTMVPVVLACLIGALALTAVSIFVLARSTQNWQSMVRMIEPGLTAFIVAVILTVWATRSRSIAVRTAAGAVWLLLVLASICATIEVSIVTTNTFFFYSSAWLITIIGMPFVLWSAAIMAKRIPVQA